MNLESLLTGHFDAGILRNYFQNGLITASQLLGPVLCVAAQCADLVRVCYFSILNQVRPQNLDNETLSSMLPLPCCRKQAELYVLGITVGSPVSAIALIPE